MWELLESRVNIFTCGLNQESRISFFFYRLWLSIYKNQTETQNNLKTPFLLGESEFGRKEFRWDGILGESEFGQIWFGDNYFSDEPRWTFNSRSVYQTWIGNHSVPYSKKKFMYCLSGPSDQWYRSDTKLALEILLVLRHRLIGPCPYHKFYWYITRKNDTVPSLD